MEIIKIEYETEMFFDEDELLSNGLKYYHNGEGFNFNSVVKFINDFYKSSGLVGATTPEEAVVPMIIGLPKNTKEAVLFEFNRWNDGQYDSVEELLEDGLFLDVVEQVYRNMNEDDLSLWIQKIIEFNKFHVGTAGYSPWAKYIAHESVSHDYAESVYTGANFYYIASLDESGDIKDSLGMVYAENMDTLIDYIKDDLVGDKKFALVENDITRDWSVRKVREVKRFEYVLDWFTE